MARILLLEPDYLLAQTYVDTLKTAGYEVQACTTAQGALEIADQARPDVVLLELQLVAHSGIEFLYEFRSYADWRDIPVVIVSKVPPAEFNECTRMFKKHLGIAAYCYKPRTTLQNLLHTVAATLTDKQLKVV